MTNIAKRANIFGGFKAIDLLSNIFYRQPKNKLS